MQDPGAVAEFLEETWGILDSLSAACASGKAPVAFKEGLKTIERNLHTIKGNAAAFGFEDLSGAASRTLDWLREEMRVTGKSLERPEDISPVIELTRRLRQYLAIVNPQEAPPPGFWTEAAAPAPQPSTTGRKESPGGRRGSSTTRPNAEPDWDEEAKRILAQAPLVTPKIDAIVWMAIQKLTGEPHPAPDGTPAAEGPGKPEPSAAPAKPESACAVSTSVHAYALEAVVKAAWLRRLQEKCHANSWLESAFSQAADVLSSFGRWSVETRSVPLSSFLTGPLAQAKWKAVSPGCVPLVEWTGTDVLVVPAVGKLIQVLFDEVLRGVLAARDQNPEAHLDVKVAAARAGGLFKLSVTGLTELERAKPRLHLELLRQRVERCGVSFVRGAEPGGESLLSLSVPDHLDGMEALIAATGGNRMGLPWHRVHGVLDPGDIGDPSRGQGCWLEARGEKLPLLDLAAGTGAGTRQGAVVIIKTDKGKRALKVDEVLGRQEVIVSAPEHDAQPGEASSPCLALEGLEWMPFLWCSSRLFEQQESLVSRL